MQKITTILMNISQLLDSKVHHSIKGYKFPVEIVILFVTSELHWRAKLWIQKKISTVVLIIPVTKVK